MYLYMFIHIHTDLFLSQDDRIFTNHKIMEKNRFYYKNGLRDLFVQIDLVHTFHFCQGISRKCFIKAWKIIPDFWIIFGKVWDDFPGFYNTFPRNSLTKMEGTDQIYLDK